jgi:hypothetical protein
MTASDRNRRAVSVAEYRTNQSCHYIWLSKCGFHSKIPRGCDLDDCATVCKIRSQVSLQVHNTPDI